MKLSPEIIKRCIRTIDAGLVCGMGVAEPGKMCVEAAINYALGRPHGDDPGCVAQSVRRLKICLNDSMWKDDADRAKGLRRLAIAQLGTSENFNETEFAIRVSMVCHKDFGFLRWASAWLDGSDTSEGAAAAVSAAALSAWAAAANAAERSAAESARMSAAAAAAAGAARMSAAESARMSAGAAAAAAAESARMSAWEAWEAAALHAFAESVAQILIKMETPGSKYLYLTEEVSDA